MQQTVALSGTPMQRISRPIQWLGVLACLISSSGCLSLPTELGKDKYIDRGGIDAILTSSDRQMLVMKDGSSKERFCLAPGPDYSVTASRGVSLGMGMGGPVGPKGEETVGGDASRGALSLGGRNPEVLIARALMYRACEMVMNLNADQDTAIKIYTRFLEAIEKISKFQTGTGTASVVATPADARLQSPRVVAPGQPSSPDGFSAGGSGAFGMPSAQPSVFPDTPPAGIVPGQPSSPDGFPVGGPGTPGMPPAQPGVFPDTPSAGTQLPPPVGIVPGQPSSPGIVPAGGSGVPGMPPVQPSAPPVTPP